tara:strand:+ start:18420 stop:20486 length:2067 start_codon:yes stop_codon:yes gene_type:complete
LIVTYNTYKKLLSLLCLLTFGFLYPQVSVSQEFFVLTEAMLISQGEIELTEDWFAKSGDNFTWKNPEFNFSDWKKVHSLLENEDLQELNWEGYGWFKKTIQIDSSLIGVPLMLNFKHHSGASQVYLNNDLIYRIGDFSILSEDEQTQSEPSKLFFQLFDTTKQVLSIRFSNHQAKVFTKYGLSPGFTVSIQSDKEFFSKLEVNELTTSNHFLFILLGLLTAISIVHFLFLIFYPQGEKNLYFVLFSAGITLFSIFYNFESISSSPSFLLVVQKGIFIGWLVALVGLLKFAYSFLKNSTPIQLSFLLVIGLTIIIIRIGGWFDVSFFISVFTIISFLEVLRVYLILLIKQKERISILLWGFLIYLSFILFSIENYDLLINSPFSLVNNLLGITFLVFSISAYILKDFAKAQIKLEYKFLEVKHLSERSIEQERRSKAKEIEQKVLETENQRKTAELEEARALQISMLPAQIPNTEYWDIDAYMNPSQEVGGDYYDFGLSKNGELTVALGDATGHGMKAGIIVATAKSYFHSLVNEYDNISIVKNMSSGIKNLDIKMMYMGLMLLKCSERSIKFTSAGMPPALLFRRKENRVEEVLLKAMPLGSSVNFPYEELDFNVEAGDVFLLFSDGLMELFNSSREQLGMENIKQCLLNFSDLKASEILLELKKLQTKWSGDSIQEDDVTILVMKAK